MLYNSKFAIQIMIYDFSDILINGNKIKEILNKYFWKLIQRKIMMNITVDELVDFINYSKYFFNNNFNFYALYEYINNKDKIKSLEKEKNNNNNKTKNKNKK
jgi:phage-related holin